MLRSHIIEFDGAFVGAAVEVPDGFKFVAVDVCLDDLDGQIQPTLNDLRRIVRVAYLRCRPPARRPAPLELRTV